MPIKLYYSNDLQKLFVAFYQNLKRQRGSSFHPFIPHEIVGLNKYIKRWLQIKLAQKSGIATNLNFPFLEEALWHMLEVNDTNSVKPHLLNKEKLKTKVFQTLLLNDVEPLKIYRDYVYGKSSRSQQEIRAWNLAEKLSSILLEYEYQRKEMVNGWLKNKYSQKEPVQHEIAQCYLYQTLIDPIDGFFANADTPYMSLFQYSKKLSNGIDSSMHANRPLHIFAISQISPFHQELLMQLAKKNDFYIYAFNPCMEYWEDTHTLGEDHWKTFINEKQLKISSDEIEKGELLQDEKDNYLLKVWGKTGREYIRLMSQMVNYQFLENYRLPLDAGKVSLLSQIQQNVLLRENESPHKIVQDNSLQIIKAPSVKREVEAVFENIAWHLNQDSQLKPYEIVILVPSLKTYKAALLSVFQKNKAIPFGICGNHANEECHWGEGLKAILHFAQSHFTKSAFFQVVANPCVQTSFAISEDDLECWRKWSDKYHIFHHYSRKEKKDEGFIDTEKFTWLQACKRLRLGRFFSEDDKMILERYQGEILYTISKEDEPSLEKFIKVIEALNHLVYRMKAKNDITQWREIIYEINLHWLAIPNDLQEEGVYVRQFFENFDTYFKNNSFDENLSIRFMMQFSTECLSAIETTKGGFMTSGIVISELQPMRPFPFKIKYILGLGASNFPGKDNISPVDLRRIKRKIGDIGLVDRNRYLFLEHLMTVQEKCYLSYVYKNFKTDEDYEPSSVLYQLCSYLNEHVLQKPFVLADTPYFSFDGQEHQDFSDFIQHGQQSSKYFNDLFIRKIDPSSEQENKYHPNFKEVDLKEVETPTRLRVDQFDKYVANPFSALVNGRYKLKLDQAEDGVDEDYERLGAGKYDLQNLYFELLSGFLCDNIHLKKSISWKEFLKDYESKIYELEYLKNSWGETAFHKYQRIKSNEYLIGQEEQVSNILQKMKNCQSYWSKISFDTHLSKNWLSHHHLLVSEPFSSLEVESIEWRGVMERIAFDPTQSAIFCLFSPNSNKVLNQLKLIKMACLFKYNILDPEQVSQIYYIDKDLRMISLEKSGVELLALFDQMMSNYFTKKNNIYFDFTWATSAPIIKSISNMNDFELLQFIELNFLKDKEDNFKTTSDVLAFECFSLNENSIKEFRGHIFALLEYLKK